jgi:hypothetical protein
MKVFVYFNLRKHVWSLKALEGANKGRVIAHRKQVLLADCVFKVSELGRQRVLRERAKNVHAGVVGHWVMKLKGRCPRAVGYNPYKGPTFTDKRTLEPVFTASRAILKDRQVFIPA